MSRSADDGADANDAQWFSGNCAATTAWMAMWTAAVWRPPSEACSCLGGRRTDVVVGVAVAGTFESGRAKTTTTQSRRCLWERQPLSTS